MYANLGADPVDLQAPAGSDVRYEDVFELLQAEIDKLASPAARDSFDWQTVAGLSSGILKDHSKDLLVASYLSVSLVNLEGVKGLDAASCIYCDILENYWEILFPLKKRMRGRISALRWWIENIEKALNSEINLNVDPETASTILDRFNRIDTFLQNNLEVEISLLPLIRQLENMLPKNSPGGKNHSGSSDSAKSQVVNRQESLVESEEAGIINAQDAIKSLVSSFQKIKHAAKVVRDEELHNAQPYRWLRFSVWEGVKNLPLSVNGVTKIPPPSQQIIKHIENLKNDEDWAGVINSSESALFNPQNIFLLDLNFYTAESLLRLGKKYEKAHGVVCRETEHLLERLSGLDNLAFSGGLPFASAEAKEWLQQLRASASHSGGEDASVEISSGEKVIADEIQKASDLAKEKGKIFEAVAGLQNKINSCLSRKESMLLRLGLVKMLMLEKNEKVVTPHIELILKDVLEYRLDRWEPELALKCLKIVYKGFATHSDGTYKKRTGEILRLIAGINTVEAMKL